MIVKVPDNGTVSYSMFKGVKAQEEWRAWAWFAFLTDAALREFESMQKNKTYV